MTYKHILLELKWITTYILISITLTSIILYNYNYETILLLIKITLESKNSFLFISTNLTDLIHMYIFLSISLGLILNIPIIQFFLLKFKFKGMYLSEKKGKIFNLIVVTLLIILFNKLFLFEGIPIIIEYLTNLNVKDTFKPLEISLQLKVKDYIIILISSIFLFNLNFIFLYIILKKLKKSYWVKKKNLLYIFFLTTFAIITPPDILSLLIFVLPIIIFLEIIHLYINIYKYYN